MIKVNDLTGALSRMLVAAMICSLFWQTGMAYAIGGTAPAEQPMAAPPPAVTETVYLEPVADAYVNGGYKANNNFGNGPLLLVKNMSTDLNVTRQSYLKFDLGELSGTVRSATLRLYGELPSGQGGNAVDIQVHQVDDNVWTEEGLTWNTKPEIGATIGTFTAMQSSPALRWYEVDVSAYIATREAAANDRMVGIALSQEVKNGMVVQFNSKENSENRPQLKIEYEPEPPQMKTMDMLPSDDAFVRGDSYYANQNFGAETTLVVKKAEPVVTRESYLKFDFTQISGDVVSAALVLHGAVADGAAANTLLHQVTDDHWTEQTLTWNTKPAYQADAYRTFAVDKNKKNYELDVTGFVQAKLIANRYASFALVQPDQTGLVVAFNSKEHAENRPFLRVKYMPVEDEEAPLWPTGSQLISSAAGYDSIRLQWPAAADNQAVSQYRIHRDGQLIGTVASDIFAYTVGGLEPGKTYTFKVEAGDPAGNWSTGGPSVTVKTPYVVKLPPQADTYANGGSMADRNYGDSQTLLVKNQEDSVYITREAYMKFDLQSFSGELGSAKLFFYGAKTDGGGTAIDTQYYGVDDNSWEENTLTWMNRPEPDHYMGNVSVDKTYKWHELDVTAYVRQQLAADDQQVSFMFKQKAPEGLVVAIHSRENSINPPYLLLTDMISDAAAPRWKADSKLAITVAGEDSSILRWTPADYAEAVAAYRIYQDGELLTTVDGATTQYEHRQLKMGQRYTFKIEAGNAAGQWSEDGPIASATQPITKLKQTAMGNIFLQNEPVKFIVESIRPTIKWTVYDLHGAQVAQGVEQPVGGKAEIDVILQQVGYFDLRVSAEANQPGVEPFIVQTPFTVFTPFNLPAGTDSPFGLNTHLHRAGFGWNANLSKLIRYAGATFVRDGMEWGGIETAKGVYTFPPSLDNYMQRLKDDGISMLLFAAFNNPFYDNNATPYTDEGRKGLAEYAKAYVARYKDQLIGLNVYNEFNGGFGKRGNSPANSQPEYYLKLMKEMYATVKPAHPEVPIVGVVSAGIPLDWIETVIKDDGLDYLDEISVQPYNYPNTPEALAGDIQNLHELIAEYNTSGKNIPVWLSEFGWPTYQSSRGVDEKTQADFLLRGYVMGLGNGVSKMAWYDLMDDGLQPDLNEDNFGIIHNAGSAKGAYTPKPAYAAYAAMTRELTGAGFVEIEQTPEPIRSYRFEKDGAPLRVVWAMESTHAAISADTAIEITDMMGNTKSYTPLNGKVYVTLTGEPYYVKGNVTSIVADATFAVTGEPTVEGDPTQMIVSTELSAASELTLAVEGASYPLAAMRSQPITAANGKVDFRFVTIDVMAGNKRIGTLGYKVTTQPSHEVKVRPVMELQEEAAGAAYSQALNIEVSNFSKVRELQVKKVEWKIGDQLAGERVWNEAIATGSAGKLAIPLPAIALRDNQKSFFRVEFAGEEAYEYEGNIGFNPIFTGKVAINDKIEPELAAAAPTIDLSKGKAVLASGFTGSIDVRGHIWATYDEEHFYLTANVTDDIHYASVSGTGIWNNDSIQFALSPGIPGESRSWYEYGISDSPDGPQVFRWTAPPGISTGLVENAKLAVTRDEQQKLTIYKLALPWSELASIKPWRGEAASLSLLVNDNDGAGRRGWMEWGSGIGAEKRPSQYRSIQWMHEEGAPIAHDGSFTVKLEAGATDPFTGTLQAEGTAALTYEIVGNGKQGTAAIVDGRTGEFTYTPLATASGEDVFTFRVSDRYGYSNTAKVAIAIERKPVQPPYYPGGTVKEEVSNSVPDSTLRDIAGHWGEPWIVQAIQAGIVNGYEDGTFQPDQAVSRQELIVMLARALRWDRDSGDLSRGGMPAFIDRDNIGSWAVNAVMRAAAEGLITGYDDGSLRPQGDMTRAEMAVVVARAAKLPIGSGLDQGVSRFRDDAEIPDWAKMYVNAAVAAELLQGIGDGKFAPAGTVTRAEAAAISIRLLELLK